jgi:hypothetical protein
LYQYSARLTWKHLAEIRVPQRRQVMANNRFSCAILFAPGYYSSVRFEPLPEIDSEGPWKRQISGQQAGDFLFPQQANDFPQSAQGKRWVPNFLDYLFVAFTGATALIPADTYPLTRTAKTLMMMEALISLTVIGILIARAVNILGK